MKKFIVLSTLFAFVSLSACGDNKSGSMPNEETAADSAAASESALPKVYMTREITPEALVKIYEALGRPAEGRVAVKISTGEPGGHNFLQPALIKDLVQQVKGTIVECNTAYAGKRSTTAEHLQAARDHGFFDIANVDIMDAEGEIKIPVQDDTHIKYDLVGSHLGNYDFMVNLAHFKGHAMGGFGGVLKNQSIGVASANGKAYIHTAGKTENTGELWQNIGEQDAFLESMAAAAQAVHNYFGDKILYINVMNNLSIDCDCDAHPHDAEMKDIGILASTDPVALDQACLDLVFAVNPSDGNNNQPLVNRIRQLHGTHTVEYAAQIGLGSMKYKLVSIDSKMEEAKEMIRDGKAECVLVKNDTIYRQERGHGVSPLLVMYDEHKEAMLGATVVDKVIGRAAAAIAICGKVKHVHGELMSEDAVEFLNDNGITTSYTKLVHRILNRKMDGLCPLEQSVEGITDAANALVSLRKRIATLQSHD